jgi:hypothetical protein
MRMRTIAWSLVGVIGFCGAAWSQSLAEVARKEAERRKTIQAPAKVYTDADLHRLPVTPPPEPQAADPTKTAATGDKPAAGTEDAARPARPAEPAKPVEPSVDLGEEYWRKLITDARSALARSSSYLEALQQRVRALTNQFYTLEDPVQRNAAAAQRNKVLDDVEHLKQEMAAQEQAIAKVETDARKANVPPGWIR